MHLATARAILATPATHRTHDVIFADPALIWAEHGDEVEQFNAVAAAQGWGEITVRCEDGPGDEQRFFYTYKGRETSVPYECDREDNMRSVHCIAAMVADDAVLYACNDVSGNSEWSFLALPPAQWRALEAEFGADAMAMRFTRVCGTYDDFCEQYFSDKNALRVYADEGDDAQDADEDPLAVLMAAIEAIGKDRGYRCSASYTLVLGTQLNILIIGGNQRESAALFKHGDFGAEVTACCQNLCLQSGYQLQCIAFLSQQELDADTEGKWTFGWMTRGACAQLRFDVGPSALAEPAPPVPSHMQFFARHWLTIAFFAGMLAVLIFGN